ncbi:MAG TPA: ABZJ_00895 family protein [Solimonas sp.]
MNEPSDDLRVTPTDAVPPNDKAVALGAYVLRFIVVYAALLVATAALSFWLKLEHNSGLSMAVLIAAAYFVAAAFVNAQHRAPDPAERRTLAWACLGGTWLVSLLMVGAVSLFNAAPGELAALRAQFTPTLIGILLGAALLISLFQLLLLYLIYGWGARLLLRAGARRTR